MIALGIAFLAVLDNTLDKVDNIEFVEDSLCRPIPCTKCFSACVKAIVFFNIRQNNKTITLRLTDYSI